MDFYSLECCLVLCSASPKSCCYGEFICISPSCRTRWRHLIRTICPKHPWRPNRAPDDGRSTSRTRNAGTSRNRSGPVKGRRPRRENFPDPSLTEHLWEVPGRSRSMKVPLCVHLWSWGYQHQRIDGRSSEYCECQGGSSFDQNSSGTSSGGILTRKQVLFWIKVHYSGDETNSTSALIDQDLSTYFLKFFSIGPAHRDSAPSWPSGLV